MRACTNVAVTPRSMAEHCHSIVAVSRQPSAIEIHDRAFAFCRKLGTITRHKTVQCMHDAFRGCGALHTCVCLYEHPPVSSGEHGSVDSIGCIIFDEATLKTTRLWGELAYFPYPSDYVSENYCLSTNFSWCFYCRRHTKPKHTFAPRYSPAYGAPSQTHKTKTHSHHDNRPPWLTVHLHRIPPCGTSS